MVQHADIDHTGLTGVGGGGGGLTHSYVGYNTIGGSTEAIVTLRQYMKKITVATDGMLSSIGAYIKQATAGEVMAIAASVLTDNAGDPDHTLALNVNVSPSSFLANSNGVAGDAGWVHTPIGLWLPAADYWLAVMFQCAASSHNIYKDGSGADRYFTNGGWRITDAGWTAVTTTTDRYSIRGSFLS